MSQTKSFVICLGIILNFTSNFQHSEKKDDPHRLFIFKISDCQGRGQVSV